MKSISKLAICLAAFSALAVPQPAAAQEKITFTTDFGYMGRHSYYFVAREKGFYKDVGLDVNIVRGQGSADSVKQVAAGTAQLGFADASIVILGRGNDGAPVKLVSMVYHNPPHAIFTLESSGIKKPKDLEGKRIADTAASALKNLFPAYAKAAGIDDKTINWIIITPDARAGTLSLGRADAVPDYLMGQALFQKTIGDKKMLRFTYAEAGMKFYSNGIIANDSFIKSNPDTIKRFLAATYRGLKYSLAHPEEAAQILKKNHSHIDLDIGEAETRTVATLVQNPENPTGAIDPELLQKTIDLVSNAFDLKSKVTVNDVYAPGFIGN